MRRLICGIYHIYVHRVALRQTVVKKALNIFKAGRPNIQRATSQCPRRVKACVIGFSFREHESGDDTEPWKTPVISSGKRCAQPNSVTTRQHTPFAQMTNFQSPSLQALSRSDVLIFNAPRESRTETYSAFPLKSSYENLCRTHTFVQDHVDERKNCVHSFEGVMPLIRPSWIEQSQRTLNR